MNLTTTSEIPFEKLPDAVSTIMRLVSLLIIILNTIVLSCLIIKKSTLPQVYWIQMTCLSLNDIIAGLSSFLVSFLDFPEFSRSIFLCCGTMAFFISSQAATLYNIFIICIRRLRTIQQVGSRQNGLSQKTAVAVTVAVCGASFLACLLPFIIWSRKDVLYIKSGCSMESAFGKDLQQAMKILFATFLVPLMCTNTLYCVVFFVLHRMSKRTHPSSGNVHAQAVNSSSNNSNVDLFYKQVKQTKNTSSSVRHNIIHSVSISCSKVQQHSSKSEQPTNASNSASLRPPLTRQFTASIKPNSTSPFTLANDSSALNSASRNNGAPSLETMTPDRERATVRTNTSIRKAYRLLGMILALLNVFTWPAVVVLMMETNISSWSLRRPVKFPLFTTVSWNAVVNPIIYTIQVKEFRTALFGMISSYFKSLKAVTRRR